MPRDCTEWARLLRLPAVEANLWRPLADIYRTRRGWLVKCEIAGVQPEDIVLRIEGSRLVLCGTRRDWSLEEGCAHYRLEISYSHFERTIELPENLDRARITTEYRQGMLLVWIEKEAQ